ncbi:hypothetical protein [Pelomonas sp. KK5]|uniref:hypothetical protein n=1 Tax=Pelomonas sp. KK5 TaxID=1855730 RepID=UPI0009F8676A|nr:hypothetical protein [Pelomonas sp. KK5]
MQDLTPFGGRQRWALAAIAALAVAPAAHATQLVPQNLTQMIAKADTIVAGRVTSVSDGISPEGVPYTEVTLKLSAAPKPVVAAAAASRGSSRAAASQSAAAAPATYTFRQYGLLKPRRMSDGRYLLPARIEGMPTWRVGEQVMSFMNKPAARTGLTTPVGLAQGKLTIEGTRAVNAFNNVGLFDKVQVSAGLLQGREAAMLGQTSGGVDLAVLQGLVQRAVKGNWVSSGAMR